MQRLMNEAKKKNLSNRSNKNAKKIYNSLKNLAAKMFDKITKQSFKKITVQMHFNLSKNTTARRVRSTCIIDDGASRRRTRNARFRDRRDDHSTTSMCMFLI